MHFFYLPGLEHFLGNNDLWGPLNMKEKKNIEAGPHRDLLYFDRCYFLSPTHGSCWTILLRVLSEKDSRNKKATAVPRRNKKARAEPPEQES
jgi:hypothetical protein